MRRASERRKFKLSGILAFAVAIALSLTVFGGTASAASSPLVVPTEYPTIQAAIDAADPGDTIRVRAGTYTEQVEVTKDVQIEGDGMDATIIRAPAALAPGQLGFPTIVEIYDGAAVSMSRLTVAGPGAVCGAVDENGDPVPLLRAGVQVHSEAHLDFGHAAVRDIHNTPMAQCPRFGAGIAVLELGPGAPTASANIHHAEVTDYGGVGVIVRGAGSSANVTHSLVAGPGHEGGAPTHGIQLSTGAVGRIAHNTVSGNICPDGMPERCGPDFFSQFQFAGIVAFSGAGTVVTHNRVVGNQIGLYLSEADEISHNVAIDNDYFGIGLVGVDTGQFTLEHERIRGGGGGIWVVPLVDMTVNLEKVKFSDLSGPAVEVLECVGATATVIGGPEPVVGVCP